MSEKNTVTRLALPEGRVINVSLFEKEAYQGQEGSAPGTPLYKIELAFDPTDLVKAEDALVAAAVAKWGAAAEADYDNGKIASPILDGNVIKSAREERKKDGSAYENKLVLRASTAFNRHGINGPGGIYVCGPDASEITPAQADEIYRGMYGIAIVSPKAWVAGNARGVKFYLVAFQKTRDGERLGSALDYSTLFEPVKGVTEPGARARRTR